MDNPLGNQRDWRAIGTASGIGCSIVASLLMCIGGGALLDRWLGTMPLFTLVGVVLGMASAGYLLYQLAMTVRPVKRPVGQQEPDSIDRSAKPNEEEP